jgi:2-phosphosulfolactate phosphatase
MDAHFLGTSQVSGTPPVAVVVDAMRAFTVAAWLLARGAERIVLAASEDEALDLKERNAEWLALKDGAPAPGFDAVNSPGLIASTGPAELSGRTVVQKTTAGTVGALAVADAPLVLCAGFVVAGATARVLRAANARRATFVITGDDGRGDEDLACAEYIRARVESADVDLAPFLRRARASRAAEDLREGLRRGYRGVHPDDVELCLDIDRFPFALVVRHEGPLKVLQARRPPSHC